MAANNAQAILSAAMQLSTEQRAELAEQLWASLDAAHQARIDAAIAMECQRRAEAMDAGNISAVEGDPVIDALKRGQRP